MFVFPGHSGEVDYRDAPVLNFHDSGSHDRSRRYIEQGAVERSAISNLATIELLVLVLHPCLSLDA